MENKYIINFISRWEPRKIQTWSGINWGLFKALSNYFTVNDVDVSIVKKKPLYRLKSFISTRTPMHIYDLDIKLIKDTRRYLYSRKFESDVYFQFNEAVEDIEGRKTYIFIDESVDHVLYLKKHHPDIFKFSNYVHSTERAIELRSKSQNSYLKNCAGIFTLCHWLVDDLVNRTGIPSNKVHYAGSGINVDISSIDYSKKERKRLLFVGKDFVRKGGVHVVESFKLLRNRFPEAELYVAGPKVNPIKENIPGYHYMGLCNREQLNELYNLCDVFVMPSYFEAFGIVLVEALTFGLPCLVRDCQDMPTVIEDGITGVVINTDDAVYTSKKMYELLTDIKYTENVKRKKNFYQSYYSWDAVACRIHNVISSNLQKND